MQQGIESDQNKIIEIQLRIRQLKTKRSDAKFVELPPVTDCNGANIKIRALVKIVNTYTCFSTKHPKPRGSRKPLIRGGNVEGYDSDKFGTVEYVQRTGHCRERFDKVHFITDSGFQTWRAASNLSVYNGERGNVNKPNGQAFHDTQLE